MRLAAERRLHPLTLVFGFASSLREQVIPLAAALLGGLHAEGVPGMMFGGSAVLVLFAIAAVARYARFTYRYDPDELVINSGVLFRQERHIPYARIQNIDAVQNVVHRMFDVVVVHVQTGAGAEPEASFRVLPVVGLDEMRERVRGAGGRVGARRPMPEPSAATEPAPAMPVVAAPGTEPLEERLLLRLGTRELLLSGFIESRGLVVVLGALAVLERANVIERVVPVLEEPAVQAAIGRWTAAGVLTLRGALFAIAAVLVLLFVVRLLSTLWTAVRLHDYRLVKIGDVLRTEYGLLTRVTATVPLRRIQLVTVSDRVLHRVFGRCRVAVATAGGTSGRHGTPRRERIAPILRRDRLPELLSELEPGLDPDRLDWQPVHPRAFGRMVRGGLVWPIVLSAAAAPFIGWWSLAIFGILLARLAFDRALRARRLGWALAGSTFAMRGGGLTRSMRFARFDRMQVVSLSQDPFDRRSEMADLTVDTAGAGGGIEVPYLPAPVAARLQASLSARVAASEFAW